MQKHWQQSISREEDMQAELRAIRMQISEIETQLNDVYRVALSASLEQLAARRKAALRDLQRELSNWQATRPARSAKEDRRRKQTENIRPLSVGEQDILRARGNIIIRFVMIIFIARIAPGIIRRKAGEIRDMRKQEQRMWEWKINDLQHQIARMEHELRFPGDSPEIRSLRLDIQHAERTLVSLRGRAGILEEKLAAMADSFPDTVDSSLYPGICPVNSSEGASEHLSDPFAVAFLQELHIALNAIPYDVLLGLQG